MVLRILNRPITKQFMRFCLVGIESTVLTYLTFLIMYNFLGFNYLIASGTGFIAGVFLGFIFNKEYTFRSHKNVAITFPQYLLIYLISLSFSLISIKFLVERLNFLPIISMLLINPIVLLINFFGTKIAVFKNRKW